MLPNQESDCKPPSLSYTIEDFSESIRDAYVELFSDTPEKLAELNWRFQNLPSGKAQFAVARDEDEKIVGLIALVPTPLRGSSGELRGVQAIDTIVSPLARGRFIFIRLGKIIHESPMVEADLVWGFPNALAARGWFGKLRWERFGSAPFLVKPLRSGYLLGRLWRPLQRIDFPLSPNASRIQGTIINEIDERWDELWKTCVSDFGVAVDRSAHWLRWRLKKPGAGYRFALKVGPDGSEAAVITRVIRKHGATICYVMEALSVPKHRRALQQLLKQELRVAARQGADLALAWCPKHAANRVSYSRTGFFNLPDRLRPIQIHFGGRWLSSGQSRDDELRGDKWYLSYLDSDTV